MIKNSRNKHGHIRFYCFLILLCGLCYVRYALQVDLPKNVFLLVVALIAALADQDEIIAMMMCCIPLNTSLHFFYALLICLCFFLLKYPRKIYFNSTFIPLFLMIVWELLHCFGKPFSLTMFVTNFVPLIVLAILMFYRDETIDYPFICRALSLCISLVCVTLFGRLLYIARFNVMEAIASLWRLGADTVEAQQILKIEGGDQNPNTLGVFCVLGISGLLQLRRMQLGKKVDIVQIVFLILFGTLTCSRTYLVCFAIMIVLFWISHKGGINRKFKLLLQVLLISAVAMLILYIIFPTVLEYYFNRLINRDKYLSRSELMTIYHHFIVENERILFFGIGLHNYYTELTEVYRVSSAVPHNAIQEMIIAWGLPSLILFTLLGISMVRRSRYFCKNQRLINYIPILIILLKSMVGQLLDSPYTLLALSYGYLSMRQEMISFENKRI